MNLQHEVTALFANQCRQITVLGFEDRLNTWWGPKAELVERWAQPIHQLCALTHKSFSSTEQNGLRLLFFRLRHDEAHLRPLGGHNDRFGISRIILLTLYYGPHILRSDQLYLVALLGNLASLIMRTAACLHHHRCRWLPRDEFAELYPR